jgi:hypothetical protein
VGSELEDEEDMQLTDSEDEEIQILGCKYREDSLATSLRVYSTNAHVWYQYAVKIEVDCKKKTGTHEY